MLLICSHKENKRRRFDIRNFYRYINMYIIICILYAKHQLDYKFSENYGYIFHKSYIYRPFLPML